MTVIVYGVLLFSPSIVKVLPGAFILTGLLVVTPASPHSTLEYVTCSPTLQERVMESEVVSIESISMVGLSGGGTGECTMYIGSHVHIKPYCRHSGTHK